MPFNQIIRDYYPDLTIEDVDPLSLVHPYGVSAILSYLLPYFADLSVDGVLQEAFVEQRPSTLEQAAVGPLPTLR